MITIKEFANALADWLTITILPNIPETALLVRGTARGYAELIRFRPDMVHTAIIERMPSAKALVADGLVDADALAVMAPAFMQEVKELDINALLPGITYKASEKEVQTLCNMLAKGTNTPVTNGSTGIVMG